MSRQSPLRALVLAFSLLLGACAGQTTRAPEAAPVMGEASMVDDASPDKATVATSTAAAAPATAVVTEAEATSASEPAASGNDQAAAPQSAGSQAQDTPPTTTDTATAAEDDFSALYGNPEYDPVADPTLPPGVELPSSYDPWEPFNRRMHDFNNFFDRNVATPLARLYVKAVPRPVRLGISNFFNNLGQPVNAVNALLQGRPGDAGYALLRFGVNTTIGIGGLFDPASRMNLPYINEDFGQTLAVWGWRRSRYVELPIFGPRTVRDLFGMTGDIPLSVMRHIDNNAARVGLQALQLADIRARLFSVDSMREGATDDYALYRDAWLQRRNYQILSDLDRGKRRDDGLPDYLDDAEDNPSIPINAIPIEP